MAEGVREPGGIGSALTRVAAAWETRATGGSGRMVSGLAGTAVWYEYAPLHSSLQRTLIDTGHVPVTQGLAPAPSLFEALLRECRADWGPTLESRVGIDRVPRSLPPSLVPSPLLGVGRHSRCFVWCGLATAGVLCYVMYTAGGMGLSES